ncbi:hypothetical protein ACFVVX_36415 [Kitasatospora sp. NPDC058170]|uniref:hypothetical protein n=1 Tax=Kitasatospora sp. NPDC058170 TaxID=3346364 RepID=UPI0036DD8829
MTERHRTADGRAHRPDRADDLDQFLVHYGDTIDDRVGEIVDEVVHEQLNRQRYSGLLPVLTTVLAATVVSLALMWVNPWTAAVVWAAATVICVSASRTARMSQRRW